MTSFLSVVAVLSGLIGLIAMVYGPSFTGPVWWVLTLLSLIGIPVLNFLKRIAIAIEKRD